MQRYKKKDMVPFSLPPDGIPFLALCATETHREHVEPYSQPGSTLTRRKCAYKKFLFSTKPKPGEGTSTTEKNRQNKNENCRRAYKIFLKGSGSCHFRLACQHSFLCGVITASAQKNLKATTRRQDFMDIWT